MTSTAPLVLVESLVHRYGDRAALDGVSLTVPRGEMFGLLGPNGSGKTTLFRILSTLVAPQQGRVRMFDLDPSADRDAIRRRIGVVFQSPALDKKLTVRENLRHQGHLYGMRGGPLRERIDELLARFGLADRAGESVEKLSGGLRRRVDLAKGLLHRPELLLLDEPSTGLDPLARRELGDHLEELRDRDGVTVLLTTHIMEEAERSNRLAILDRGKLVALASPRALKEQIGGDVISIETKRPGPLLDQIRSKFSLEPTLVGNTVRLERPRGHEFVPALIEAFPGEIDAVHIGKPTLEDVFIHLTGHRFEGDAV